MKSALESDAQVFAQVVHSDMLEWRGIDFISLVAPPVVADFVRAMKDAVRRA